jgi:hypothetical protein
MATDEENRIVDEWINAELDRRGITDRAAREKQRKAILKAAEQVWRESIRDQN